MEKGMTIVRLATGRRLEIPTAWLMGRAQALEAHGTPVKAAWGAAIEQWLEQEDMEAMADSEKAHRQAWELTHREPEADCADCGVPLTEAEHLHHRCPERDREELAPEEREIFGHPRLKEDES
jgi:hypothetical protein